MRQFSDVDLLIHSREYDEAVRFLKETEAGIGVDLHRNAKTLDTVAFETLFAQSKTLKCGQTEVRVLCAEDHLRVLCVHWLIDGGAKKDRLWDIYYAVENRPADFDWGRCLDVVSETRRKWIICTIALAHKYLGLKIEDTPAAGKVSEIPGWLIKTLEKEWSSGVLLLPLHQNLNDRKRLWQQIKKRLPPNAIQATVEMEGEFDERPRIFYQVGDIFLRLGPSVKRIYTAISSKG